MQTYLKLAISLPLLFAPQYANAKIVCAQDTLCIDAQRKGDNVHFFAVNRKKGMPVSGKVSLTLKNMQFASGENTRFVLAGTERKKLFTLTPKNSGKAWRYNYEFFWARGDYTAVHDAYYAYRLPYKKGTRHRVSQGCNGSFSHFGGERFSIDFNMKVGTAIHAARGGTVVDVKEDSKKGGPSKRFRDDSNFVFIQHNDKTLGLYFHLKYNGAAVKIGDHVDAGDLIGYSGNTGFSSGPHLHFEVTKAENDISEDVSIPILFQTRNGKKRCPKPGTTLVAQ